MQKQGTGILLIMLGFVALWLYTTGRFQALLDAWFNTANASKVVATSGTKVASDGGVNPIMDAIKVYTDPLGSISDQVGNIFGGLFG